MAVIQRVGSPDKTPKVDECPRDGGYAGIKEDGSLLAGS